MKRAGVDDALFFESPEALEAWLDENAEASDGIWVRMAKKHTGIASLDWKGAIDVILCFGWIDGQSRRIDEDWFAQRLTPRRPRSLWSKINREKAERLIAEGRMRPRGLAEVQRAKADGRWDAAYASPATAEVPDDFAAALRDAAVEDAFEAQSAQNRYAMLHRLMTAKRPETRARRIEQFVALLRDGRTLH